MLMMAVGVICERRQEIDPAVRRLSSPSTRVCWKRSEEIGDSSRSPPGKVGKSRGQGKVGDRLRLSRGLSIAAMAVAMLMMAVGVIFGKSRGKVGDRKSRGQATTFAGTFHRRHGRRYAHDGRRRHLRAPSGDRPGCAQTLESVNEGLLDFVVDAALVEFGGQPDGVLDGVRIRAAVTDNADALRAQ